MDRVSHTCPACGATVSVSPSLAGTRHPCPKCKATVNWPPLPRPADAEDDLPPERESSRAWSEPISFVDILTFRVMITPWLVQFAFWLGTLVCVVVGGRLILESFQDRKSHDSSELRSKADLRGDGFSSTRRDEVTVREKSDTAANTFANGFGIMFGGPFVLRIWCELAIIFFSIHRELKIANDRR